MKLTDFTFLGRKYVSMREVDDRSEQELKAGRPRWIFLGTLGLCVLGVGIYRLLPRAS